MMRVLEIGSVIVNLRKVEEFVESVSTEMNIGKEAYGKVLVAVMEAVNNAIIHGNKSDVSKRVKILFELKGEILQTVITDEGEGFAPDSIPDPTHPKNIENVRGRGVFLMRKLADNIEYNHKGNSVEMTFNMVMP